MVDGADSLNYVGAGFGGAGAEGAGGNDGAGADGAGMDGAGVSDSPVESALIMHVGEAALSCTTLEFIDCCCQNEETVVKVVGAGDPLSNASAAVEVRVDPVSARTQGNIVNIESGDFILDISFIRQYSKSKRAKWSGCAQRLAIASSMPVVGSQARVVQPESAVADCNSHLALCELQTSKDGAGVALSSKFRFRCSPGARPSQGKVEDVGI
jgi:hypothetical protein